MPDEATRDTDEGWVERSSTRMRSGTSCGRHRLDGIASFRERPGKIDIFHTLIEPELEGHGLGGQLVAGVLDDARARGLMVVPTCSFVGYYVSRHPEYADLLVG